MEVSDIIGCILGIPVVYIIFKIITRGFAYYLSFLAKIFNRDLILNGQDGPNPNTLHNLIRQDKERLLRIKRITANAKERLKNIRGSHSTFEGYGDVGYIYRDRTTEKLIKIRQLSELKEIGAITVEEFEFLKKEIINI